MTDLPAAAEDVRLPENAFRPLTPGEEYSPVVPASAGVTGRPHERPRSFSHTQVLISKMTG